MENLIKQTRLRFSANKEEDSSTSDRKTPLQKTQSFREKKKNQGWGKRQLSRQMSWDYDFNGSDYPAAVAAAAYAIQSLEESDKKETTYGREKSLSKMKSKVDDTEEKIEPLKSALRSPRKSTSGETPRASFEDTGTSKRPPEKKPSMKKKISFADTDEISGSNKPEKLPIEKTPERAPSLKRPPTFADKQLDIGESRTPISTLPKPDRSPMRQNTAQPVETRKPVVTKPGPADSAADAWEKEQMISIKERYEKLRETIDNWEAKKKKKAKRKIEKREAELDKRRAKAVKKYNSEIARIEKIAKGARAQAEANRKNEEFKVKDKTNKIRTTGKVPATCLCF